MGDWRRVSKREPCPVCGGDSYCSVHADDLVKCTRFGSGAVSKSPGYAYAGDFKPDQKGNVFARWTGPNYRDRELEPASELEEKQRREDWARARRIETARAAYRAGVEHADGGVDHPVLRRWLGETRSIPLERLPGPIPASIVWNPDTPDEWDGAAKRWTTAPAMVARITLPGGSRFEGIHRTFLDPETARKRDESDTPARKKLGECVGRVVELYDPTASGVLLLGEGIETVLACQAAAEDRAGSWASLDAVSLESLDLDALAERVEPGDEGAIAVVAIVGDLDASRRGQTAARTIAGRILERFPWLTVLVSLPSSTLYPELVAAAGVTDKPARTATGRPRKSVDWNDVLEAYGPERTLRGVLGGIDLEAARTRAREWNPDAPTPPLLRWSTERPVRILEESPVDRARRYLLDEYAPPRSERALSGFYLRRWDGIWWEYDLTRWVVVPEEHLRGRLWHWLSQWHTAGRRGRETSPLVPKKGMVDEILDVLKGEVAVVGEELPTWVPHTFDKEGAPRWGAASASVRVNAGKPQASQVIAFQNALVDVGAWAAGEVRAYTPTPLWFSPACLPGEFPLERFVEAYNAEGLEGIESLARELAPAWHEFLDDVSGGCADWVRCLQEWFGYSLVNSTRVEKILLIVGPTRSGKGTIERMWSSVLGEDNIVPTSFDRLGDRFHFSAWVAKLLAVMADAHVGQWTDRVAAVEKLKARSGGDAELIERKHKPDMMRVRLSARVVIYTNEVPNLTDSSTALAGRFVFLPMLKSYLGREDTTLKSRLAGDNEILGARLWALAGLRRLFEALDNGGGFTIPDAGSRMLEDFRLASSPIAAFADEVLAFGPEHCETIDNVFAAYRAWCDENGRRAGSKGSLGNKLRAIYAGLERTKKRMKRDDPMGGPPEERRVPHYVGVKIATPPHAYQPVDPFDAPARASGDDAPDSLLD